MSEEFEGYAYSSSLSSESFNMDIDRLSNYQESMGILNVALSVPPQYGVVSWMENTQSQLKWHVSIEGTNMFILAAWWRQSPRERYPTTIQSSEGRRERVIERREREEREKREERKIERKRERHRERKREGGSCCSLAGARSDASVPGADNDECLYEHTESERREQRTIQTTDHSTMSDHLLRFTDNTQ